MEKYYNKQSLFEEIDGQRQYDFVSDFSYIREAGTDGEKKAAEHIFRHLTNMGLSPRIESFTFPAAKILNATLTVLSPYKKEYQVSGYGFCHNTCPEGLEGDFVYLENADEISLRHAKDKIVMVHAPLKKELALQLLKYKALAVICVCGSPLDTPAEKRPASLSLPVSFYKQNGIFSLPAVSLHHLDAVEMVEKGVSRVRLCCIQSIVEQTSQNVAVRIEPVNMDNISSTDRQSSKNDILTITAHYDSVPAGPGAYDNMSGCAIIMELCRYFHLHPPKRSLEFVWFGAEEKGLLGSIAYVKEHEDDLYRHLFNMNVDLAGQLIGGTVIGVTGDVSICKFMKEIASDIDIGLSTKHQVWSSDSNTFAWRRIPSITLNRDGIGMHTRHDTIALISAWSLKRSAALLAAIASELANAKIFPLSDQIPEEFLVQLDKQFLL